MRTSNQTHPSPTIPRSLLDRVQSGKWNILLTLGVLISVAFLLVPSAPVLATRPASADTRAVAQTVRPGSTRDWSVVVRGRRTAGVPERLVEKLRYAASAGERLVLMTELEQTGDDAVPALVMGLASPEPGVRVAAAQVLGWQRATRAIAPLLNATHDPQSVVREAAVCALGEIGNLETLSRVQQLKATEGNYYVQQAAYMAEQRIQAAVADELGIGRSELHASAVASADRVAYAVTSKGVYAKKGGTWSLLANLALDRPELVATDTTGQVVFVAGQRGLYRSTDAGVTWEALQNHLAADSRIRATAVTINPRNSSHVFVAVAGIASRDAAAGIYASEDGGDTWYALPYAPSDYVTNSLKLDPSSGKYLYGVTGIGVWRYVLPVNGARSGAN